MSKEAIPDPQKGGSGFRNVQLIRLLKCRPVLAGLQKLSHYREDGGTHEEGITRYPPQT